MELIEGIKYKAAFNHYGKRWRELNESQKDALFNEVCQAYCDTVVLHKTLVETPNEIRGVKIGDIFMNGVELYCEVIDFIEERSTKTGVVEGYKCIAKGINGYAKNRFEVPFATVKRNAI